MADHSPAWGTESEKRFLQYIGTYSVTGCDRQAALRGYLKGAERRSHWGSIDGAACIALANKLLEEA